MARKFKGLEEGQNYRGAMRWMGIGIEFGIVCGFTAWLGAQLDKLEHTSPGWTIMGFFVGFGIMIYMILKRAQSSNKEIEQESKDKDEDRQ